MAFGLRGRNAVLARPDPQPAGSVGAPQHLWAKNKSSPGAADGYEFGADDLNEIIGQLRNLLQALGGDVSGTTGAELSTAMLAVLAAKIEVADLPGKGSFNDMSALEAAYPEAEAGHWAILQNGISNDASVAIWDADNDPAGWVDTGAAPSVVDWSAVTNKPARLGPTAEVVADYNSATSTGWYSAASGSTNQPASINALIEVIAFDTNNLVQIATDRASDATYYRRREAGSWGSWTQVLAIIAKSALDAKALASITVTGSGLASGGGDLSANRAIAVTAATTAQYRAGGAANAALGNAEVWAAMAEVTLTYGASLSWDMAAGFDFACAMTGNASLPNPSNIIVGKRGTIRFAQDATGSRVLTISGGYFRAAGGISTIVLSTAANAIDYLHYRVRSATEIVLSLEKDVKA